METAPGHTVSRTFIRINDPGRREQIGERDASKEDNVTLDSSKHVAVRNDLTV